MVLTLRWKYGHGQRACLLVESVAQVQSPEMSHLDFFLPISFLNPKTSNNLISLSL